MKYLEFFNLYFSKKIGFELMKIGAFRNKSLFSIIHLLGRLHITLFFIKIMNVEFARKTGKILLFLIGFAFLFGSYVYSGYNVQMEEFLKYYLIASIIIFFIID